MSLKEPTVSIWRRNHNVGRDKTYKSYGVFERDEWLGTNDASLTVASLVVVKVQITHRLGRHPTLPNAVTMLPVEGEPVNEDRLLRLHRDETTARAWVDRVFAETIQRGANIQQSIDTRSVKIVSLVADRDTLSPVLYERKR